MSTARVTRVLALLLSVAAAGCATGSSVRVRGPVGSSVAAFRDASDRIARARAGARVARTETIGLRIDASYLPGTIDARGAVAVGPPDRLRMILLGPGGTTAMDLWSHGERFRFAVPALDRVVLGDASASLEQRRGLPVDFLRWWLLDPLGGRLRAARYEGDVLALLLDDGQRTTEVRLDPDGGVHAHRRWYAPSPEPSLVDEEWIEAPAIGCTAARYRQRSTGLEVTVRCEASRPGASERALRGPEGTDDEPHGAAR